MNQTLPEIHVYAPSFEHGIAAFNAGATIVSVNGPVLGLRGEKYHVSWQQIQQLITYAKKIGVHRQVHLRLNTMIHNADLPDVREALTQAQNIGIEGIVFSDASILAQAKALDITIPLILATETTVTNSEMINFWHEQGVSKVLLSRELSISELCKLSETVNGAQLELQIHGPVGIFHTLRPVLENYATFLNEKQNNFTQGHVSLVEEKREDEYYRMFEDSRGAYIFSSSDITLYGFLEQLSRIPLHSYLINIYEQQAVDSVDKVVRLYKQAIDAIYEHTFSLPVDWKEQLTTINRYPVTQKFIEFGAPQ
ncbi:peptidase U32 family protein [Desulfuribacillus stibiiarsenatis]|uniref:peptidase U32 family protein n=1 Tax=Desulfuribacillus stibiiarsenatis TaxID=1390249 RepID=UPI001C403338|nr:U32 family peptidase [Desulfuribacillus stibiiarsenatis]